MKKTKILILTRSSWNEDNSSGNTLSNVFTNLDFEYSSVYCREELPKNNICNNYFNITEKQILSSFFGIRGKSIVGKRVGETYSEKLLDTAKVEASFYAKARNYKFTILLWIREMIWLLGFGSLKYNLYNFLEKQKPDIIYFPVSDSIYMFKLLKIIQSYTNAKSVIIVGDDRIVNTKPPFCRILKRINYYFLRKNIESVISNADKIYANNEYLAIEYKKLFGKEIGIIRKAIDTASICGVRKLGKQKDSVNLIYAGNIIYNRYKSLAIMARVLDEINGNNNFYRLDIYTNNTLTTEMDKEFKGVNSVSFKEALPYNEINKKISEYDMAVHVESFDEDFIKQTKLSFSTKLIDFFEIGCAILAFGDKELASMRYLIDNTAAAYASDVVELKKNLLRIKEDVSLIDVYRKNSYNCRELNSVEVRNNMIINDFNELLKNR